MYFVYIAKCSDDSLYSWITTDLKRREKQHNWEISWGAKYTLSRKPVKIVYFEKFENRSLATKREIELKKLKKSQKLKLISENMKNELFKKLEKYTLQDAINFEQNDRQFLALKKLWENIRSRSILLSKKEGIKESLSHWEGFRESLKIYFYLSLILWNSIVCYQLSGKWEDYWEEFWEYFSDKFIENFLPADLIDLLANFLRVCKKNRRFTEAKITRLQKFLPFLEEFLGQEKYFYENMTKLQEKIAKTMKQKKDAKTVVFAVKMFSYWARNIFDFIEFPNDLLIPIDSRLTNLFENYWNENEKIEDFYKNLSLDLKIPMMHLDAVVWTNYDELME